MDLFARIKRLLVAINAVGPDARVEGPMRLREDLGVDSLTMVRLVAAVRDEFGFQVRAREMTPKNFLSVDSLAAYLETRLTEQGPPPSSAPSSPGFVR